MVRQFNLVNSLGQQFDLMRKDALFLSPDGLGFSTQNEYAEIGADFLLVNQKANQKVVTGEMLFDGYEQYKEFASFISNTPLWLGYKPMNTWYYLDCTVTNLSKTEIQYTDRKLHCNIDFTAMSKWYAKNTFGRIMSDSVSPKQYDYVYDYTYVDAVNGVVPLTNEGSEDSPCIITIFGPIDNPNWDLLVNGEIVQSGSITGSVAEGKKLMIDSTDSNNEIAIYDSLTNAFEENVYQKINFDEQTFIMLPRGTSTLRVTGETTGNVNAVVEVHEIHETV